VGVFFLERETLFVSFRHRGRLLGGLEEAKLSSLLNVMLLIEKWAARIKKEDLKGKNGRIGPSMNLTLIRNGNETIFMFIFNGGKSGWLQVRLIKGKTGTENRELTVVLKKREEKRRVSGSGKVRLKKRPG